MTIQPSTSLSLRESYPALLESIKTRIRESQVKAAMAVNQELIKLHWWIGSEIVSAKKPKGGRLKSSTDSAKTFNPDPRD